MTAIYAVIPAAGRGERFSTSGVNKVFARICGRPMLSWTAAAFSRHPDVRGIVVVAASGEIDACRAVLNGIDKVLAVVPGGATRTESVAAGLRAVEAGDDEIVMIHDAARPLVDRAVIDRCLEGALRHGCAVAALPVADTLKRAGVDRVVEETVDRAGLWAMQTPQAFRVGLIRRAYAEAERRRETATDDAALLERCGERVHLVEGSPENFKVTRSADLALAEGLTAMRLGGAAARIGFGYDIHRLAAGRRLVLGGVEIPTADGRGLDGHSDADVLLHAICDALLGAAGQPDIGTLFPNTDPAYAGADSAGLLRDVANRLCSLGYAIGNIDSTVIAERPRIAPHVQEMRARIADILSISREQVGIKATTNEGLGALGESLGIAAHAVATINRP